MTSHYDEKTRDGLVDILVMQGMKPSRARMTVDLGCQASDEAFAAMLKVARLSEGLHTFGEVSQMALVLISERADAELKALTAAITIVNDTISRKDTDT